MKTPSDDGEMFVITFLLKREFQIFGTCLRLFPAPLLGSCHLQIPSLFFLPIIWLQNVSVEFKAMTDVQEMINGMGVIWLPGVVISNNMCSSHALSF